MASQTKRKHSETLKIDELHDLCYDIRYNVEESFDSVRKWLYTNKDDTSRLKAAITYQGRCNSTPLHHSLCKQPPLGIIQTIIKYAPEGLNMKNYGGRLPIHSACSRGASLEVIQALLTASPDTIKVRDNDGMLPLHCACYCGASLAVLNLLIESYPKGMDHEDKDGRIPLDILKQNEYAKKKDDNGMLVLHHAYKNGYSPHLIHFLILAYPKSFNMKDKHGRIPLDYYTSVKERQSSNKINERTRTLPMVSPGPVPVTIFAEPPTVAQVENQPLPQMTQEDTSAVSNVSSASSSENFQTATPAASYGNTSAAHSKKRSYQEIKKDFEESDAALLQARNEKNKQRIRFFKVANNVLTKELKSIQ